MHLFYTMYQHGKAKPAKHFLYWMFFFILNEQNLPTGKEICDVSDVVRVTEFQGNRLKYETMELKMYCNLGKVECFFKCLNNTACISFAVMVNESCVGTLCLLYSDSHIKNDHLLADTTSTYYFMASSCCNGQCLNGGACRSKVCSCACAKGYTSTNCIYPSEFTAHNWKTIPGALTQIDSSHQTWGVQNSDKTIWVLENGQWKQIAGGLTHVTSGKAGVWGVNHNDWIFYREGVTDSSPYGTSWRNVYGGLRQIDSGSFGVVYGINSVNLLYCRRGIQDSAPYGEKWARFGGTFKYVSCGDYGCWVIRMDSSTAFRTGVTAHNCAGTGWLDVDGEFTQLDAGLNGMVYAVTTDNELFFREGICALNPTGTRWQKVNGAPKIAHVAVGDSGLFVLLMDETILTTL